MILKDTFFKIGSNTVIRITLLLEKQGEMWESAEILDLNKRQKKKLYSVGIKLSYNNKV